MAGATVVIQLVSAAKGADPRFLSIVTTDKGGTFSADALPAGTFEICPQFRGGDLLAPCMWGSPPSVTLSLDQVAEVAPITMTQGTHLAIRIDDPNGTIAAQGSAAVSAISVGIAGPRLMAIPAAVKSKDATGQNLDALIPYDRTVRVLVFSKTLALADDKGQAIDMQTGAGIAVIVPSGSRDATVTLRVTGVSQ